MGEAGGERGSKDERNHAAAERERERERRGKSRRALSRRENERRTSVEECS